MRILILSANTGGGHNTAAAAVSAAFEERGFSCEIRDALSFVSGVHSDIVSSGHSYIYRYFPQLFGVGYRFEEKHPPRFIYEQMALGAKRFVQYLEDHPIDAVVSTHIFGSMLLTEVRKKYSVEIPHYAVITDYTLYPGSDMVDVKRFFIAAEGLIPLYNEVGIDSERICVSGIPIRSSFLQPYVKSEVRRQLQLPECGRIVLLLSGSIGCGKLHRIAPEIEKELPEDATLVIVCGHNARMRHQLMERCSSRTVIVGYTDCIAEYMASADLCITKPGGLSITEMLAMELPMILMLSVPGCESRNLAFFEENKIAVGTQDWEDAIEATANLICDPNRLTQMRERMRNVGYPGGASRVVDTVMDDLNGDKMQE